MRRILRKKLSPEASRALAKLGAAVAGAPPGEQAAVARSLWRRSKRSKALKEVRRKLKRMATGRIRCMYCEDSRAVHVDHFRPLAMFPRQAFRWQNLLYACAYCNSNRKREQFPTDLSTGTPLLVKPTLDDPRDHLVLVPTTGRFTARHGSPKGNPTIRVFGLNTRPELPSGRRDAFMALQRLITEYATYRRDGDDAGAADVKAQVLRHPFSSVLDALLEIADGPAASLLRPDCLAALNAYPEIKTWL